MFKKTIFATALLVVTTIALAGPAAALEPRCVFDPASCLVEGIVEAAAGDTDETSGSSISDVNTGGLDHLAGVLGDSIGTSEPTPTVELPADVLDAIVDQVTVEIPIDPLPIEPAPSEPAGETTTTEPAAVPDVDLAASNAGAPSLADNAAPSVDSPDAAAQPAEEQPRATAELQPASGLDPLLAGLGGAVLAAAATARAAPPPISKRRS